MFVLDVTKENVIKHRDKVDVEDTILWTDQKEVQGLSWRPYKPVNEVNCQKLLILMEKHFVCFAQALASKKERCVKVVCNEHRTND